MLHGWNGRDLQTGNFSLLDRAIFGFNKLKTLVLSLDGIGMICKVATLDEIHGVSDLS